MLPLGKGRDRPASTATFIDVHIMGAIQAKEIGRLFFPEKGPSFILLARPRDAVAKGKNTIRENINR